MRLGYVCNRLGDDRNLELIIKLLNRNKELLLHELLTQCLLLQIKEFTFSS